MCRADIAPAARPLLGQILAGMATALANQAGVPASEVRCGPVDFGEATRPHPNRETEGNDTMTDKTCKSCNGEGTLTTTTWDPISHERVSQTKTCQACNGTGTR